uniref:Uncharacterized protein n=1 Tax=Macrostomum lignano TaxID=282301 RepID=A0A1I8FJ38_9PLAT
MSRAAKIFNRNVQRQLAAALAAVLADLPMDRLLLLVDFATPGVLCARNQRHTYRFVCAVELGDSEAVQSLTAFEYQPLDYKCCVANCRNLADGQPPLHKSGAEQGRRVIAAASLGRTALCYAFACTATELPTTPEAEQPQCTADSISNLLLDHGCSEFAHRLVRQDGAIVSRRGPILARQHVGSAPSFTEPATIDSPLWLSRVPRGSPWVASKRGDEGPKGRFAACCCRQKSAASTTQDCRSGGGDCGAEGGNAGLSSGGGAASTCPRLNLHRPGTTPLRFTKSQFDSNRTDDSQFDSNRTDDSQFDSNRTDDSQLTATELMTANLTATELMTANFDSNSRTDDSKFDSNSRTDDNQFDSNSRTDDSKFDSNSRTDDNQFDSNSRTDDNQFDSKQQN